MKLANKIVSVIFFLLALLPLFSWLIISKTNFSYIFTGITLIVTTGVLILLVLFRLIFIFLSSVSEKVNKWILAIILFMIIIVQLWLSFHFIDYGRADSFYVRNEAVGLSSGIHEWNNYFYVYSNNVNYTEFLAGLISVLHFLKFTNIWLVINIINFIWLDCGLFAALKIVSLKHLSPAAGNIFSILWLFSLPIYFFGLFVYSDVIALPVPIITFALWIYFDTNDGYKKYVSFGALVLLDIFSTLIKPNMIILLIAIGIMITTKLIKKQWSSKTILTFMIISIVCVFIGIGTFRLGNHVYNYQARSNEELPATSWIAMSLNPSNEGMYSLTDVRKQISLPTHNAKTNSEKNIIKKRIKMMGASGLLLHFFQKLSIFLGSGTFGGEKLTSQWEIEPSWYRENHQILNFQFTIISQMLLSFVFLNSAIGFLRRSSNYDNLLPLLIFIGLSTFHIFIWEVEARYAVPLYPLLLLWCADGIDSLKKITFKISRFNQVLLSFCLIACLGLLSFITPKVLNNRFSSTVVAEQGNGKYFSDENITLKARERVFTTVKVHEKSNILKIYGNHNSTKVLIILTMDGKTIKTTTTRLSEVTTMKYPKQNPGKITIEIKNLSNHDTSLGVVHSHYPVDSFHIRNIKNTYLTYYIMFQQ